MATFEYRKWSVQRAAKLPLLDFLVEGLKAAGCTILHASDPRHAPFLISFETPLGERHGILAYAFFANSRLTRNRPDDEHRFQIKYGGALKGVFLPVERDPSGLITTLFVGIDTERGLLVGADPNVHDMSQMSTSLEFKRSHVDAIEAKGWHAWQRDSYSKEEGDRVESLVGVTQDRVLDFIRFERLAVGLDAGHRQLLAEQLLGNPTLAETGPHALTAELKLTEREVMDLIQGASRLKMAVRGWVAERHLETYLQGVPGVERCRRLDEEGRPDLEVWFRRSGPILVECKNVLREPASDGCPRVDFQRTRASKGDPCSRYYRPADFQLLAACLHAVTEQWEYRFIPTTALPEHAKCPGRLKSNLKVDAGWHDDAAEALIRVSSNVA